MKRIIFRYIFLLIAYWISLHSFSQIIGSVDTPNLTSRTPNVAIFEKFGYYPVGNHTGVPDISIPLYEVKIEGVTVPIVLKYHASGIKVSDIASWVGLGWSLEPGGSITQSINGDNDNSSEYFDIQLKNGYHPNKDNSNYTEALYMMDGTWDALADEFTYNGPGLSGKFFFSKKDDLKTVELVMVPLTSARIDVIKINPNMNFNEFNIYNDRGCLFEFRGEGASTTTIEPTGYSPAWGLTKIVSPSTAEAINYEFYDTNFVTYDMRVADSYVVYTAGTGICRQSITPYKYWYNNSNNTRISSQERLLKKITYPKGSVEFILDETPRKDLKIRDGACGIVYSGQAFKSLNSIVIRDLNNDIIKTVVFNYTYMGSGAASRLCLNSLYIYDNIKNKKQTYSFDYYTPTLPSYNSLYRDYWGYFNGLAKTILFPYLVLLDEGFQGTKIGALEGQMEPLLENMLAGTLKKITYPTGGYTTFEYENNKYDKQGTEIQAGGLRIKKIKSYDSPNSEAFCKTYQYGPGILNSIYDGPYYKDEVTLISSCPGFLENGTILRQRSIYTCSINENFSGEDGHVIYKDVIEYTGTEVNNTGKTVYEYSNDSDSYYLELLFRNGKGIRESKRHLRGLLLSKTDYNLMTGKMVSRVDNKYGSFSKFWRKGVTFQEEVAVDNETEYMYKGEGWKEHILRAVHLVGESQDVEITESVEKIYSQDGISYTETKTEYKYDQENLKLIEKNVTNSQNGLLKTNYTYPFSYPATSNPIYTNHMIPRNRMDVIEEIINHNNMEIYRKKTDYALNSFTSNKIQPVEISTTIKGNTQSVLKYNQYDSKGKILQYTPLDGIPVIYLWSYNGQYPIAEIRGATYSQVETAAKSAFGVSSIDALSDLFSVTLLQLENFRKHTSLNGALVTTYTYKPLVGMVTATDPRGVTTYYEYDSFGRLKDCYIQDMDATGQKVKRKAQSYDYHYQN